MRQDFFFEFRWSNREKMSKKKKKEEEEEERLGYAPLVWSNGV